MYTRLFDDENGVSQLLSLEERMEIGQERRQMSLPVAERDDDGQIVTCEALVRLVHSSRFHSRVTEILN
jgi:hypothetical protein